MTYTVQSVHETLESEIITCAVNDYYACVVGRLHRIILFVQTFYGSLDMIGFFLLPVAVELESAVVWFFAKGASQKLFWKL